MKDALIFNVQGIKCDNPDCDYCDMEVKVENYGEWLNKPCPKCGANLLTQADYDNTMVLMNIAKIASSVLPPLEDDARVVKTSIKMDGTGSIKFNEDKQNAVGNLAFKLGGIMAEKYAKLEQLEEGSVEHSLLNEEIKCIYYLLQNELSEESIDVVLGETTSGSLYDALKQYKEEC